jgi:hypothetical protein
VAKTDVPIRAIIDHPPPGIAWALQLSKGDLSDLAPPVRTSPGQLAFEFTIRVEPTPAGVRLLGPGVQGPPAGRFFYLNSGSYAGQVGTPYGRRAKVPLGGITADLVAALKPGQALEVRIPGTGKDGGPTCASVHLTSPGWRVV